MPDPAVSLHQVSAVLGGKQVLRNINLEIKRGENWVIVGPNGSGKTTMLKVINGYQRISGGHASILGERFGEADLRDLRKRISMVSSYLADLVLLDDNVLDIVVSGGYAQTRLWSVPEADKVERARSLLRRLGVLKYEDRILRDLSQGERQKVIIARALMSHAELLTLDEPCAGLDLKARESFLSGLERIAKEHALSIIYVTHRIDEIPEGFDHALLLRRGGIIAKGRIERVLTSANISRCFEVKVQVKRWRGRFYPIVA